MSLDTNKALVRRYFEDIPYHPDACDQIFAPVIHWHTIQRVSLTTPDFDSNPQGEKEAIQWLNSVWSDWGMTVDELIAEDDRVMVRWTFHGTQRGELYGLPPTNRHVTYSGINIFRILEGKIADITDISDRLWMWQQLGVLPETNEFIARAIK